jgi:peptide/nickel transport system substrate-binding protein
MRKRIKGIAVLATAAAAAVVLAGCSGGGEAGGDNSAVAESSLKSTGWTVADRADVKDGGSITLPIDTAPANWQLQNLDSGTVDDTTISQTYLPSFIQFKENGEWEANKDYATSVELTKDSPQTVEIKINPKAVWSDGTPISAKDVIANWKALNGTNKAFAPLATNVWEDVDERPHRDLPVLGRRHPGPLQQGLGQGAVRRRRQDLRLRWSVHPEVLRHQRWRRDLREELQVVG